jgi:hypothetical protein
MALMSSFIRDISAIAADNVDNKLDGVRMSRLTGATRYHANASHVMSAERHNAALDHLDLIVANAENVRVTQQSHSHRIAMCLPVGVDPSKLSRGY